MRQSDWWLSADEITRWSWSKWDKAGKREIDASQTTMLSQSLCKLFTAAAFDMKWLLCSVNVCFLSHQQTHLRDCGLP